MERATRWKIRTLVWLALTAGVLAGLYHFVGWDTVMPWRFVWRGEQWELSEPVWLWLLALVPVVFLLRGFSLSDHSRFQQAVGVGLRSALLVVLALALARPRTLTEHSRVCTVFLVDVSDSVSPKQISEARRYIQKVYERRGKNLVRIVTFGKRPRAIDIAEGATKIPRLRPLQAKRVARAGSQPSPAASRGPAVGGTASDLQAALQLAHGLYPAGYVKRAVILSDGIETKGDLLSEAGRAADRGLRIHHRLYRAAPREEVLIRDLALPKKVDVGKPFKLQANVYSSHTTRATFTLKYGAAPNEMYWNERERRKTVTLKPGLNAVVFTAEVKDPGLMAYVVRMTLPKQKRSNGTLGVRDHVKENNRAVAILTVKDKPRVLLVEGHGRGRVAPFVRMMRQEDLQVEVRSGYGLPSSVWGLKKYDCVILSDVRVDLVSQTKMAALDNYVRNHGGCFIMAGGDDSFGSGGFGRTRIERMLPVRMDVDKMNRKPSVALVLVIDRSGSMGAGGKIEMAKEAAKAAAGGLGARDEIGVVAHDSNAIPIIPLTKAANRMRIMSAISTISSGGGTNIYPALQTSQRWLLSSRAKVKHVIILSDGDSEQASELPVLAEAMKGQRITVSTVGVGSGYNRVLLERIARAGGGKSFFARDPRQIPKIFLKETQRVSRTGVIDEAVKAVAVKSAAFLRGVSIREAPLLRGYNPTTIKHGADLYLRTQPFGEPLLARWRLGTGKTAAFTSDIKGRWAYAWLARWMHGAKRLWAQLLRDTMRVRTYKQFPMFTSVKDGRVHVVIDAIDKRDTFQNGLDSVLTVYDWWKPSRKRRVKLRQTSAGRYEGSFTMHRFGAYVLQADHRRVTTVRTGARSKIRRTTLAKSFGAVTLTYPPEYLQLQPSQRECRSDPELCPGQQLLGRASALTGGTSLGEPTVSARTIFDAGKIRLLRYRERWHWLAYLMLALVLLDLLLRRSRIFTRPRNMTS